MALTTDAVGTLAVQKVIGESLHWGSSLAAIRVINKGWKKLTNSVLEATLDDLKAFRVSVVIPLYNKARFIGLTLASVAAQDLAPYEIIIVNDGSSDESADVVLDFIKRHPGFRIHLLSQPNAGPGPARNRGIDEATAEWIAFLDGDDQWAPNHLSTLAEVAAAFPEVAIVAAQYSRIIASARLPDPDFGPCLIKQFSRFQFDVENNFLSSSSIAVKRQALLSVGGFGAFIPGEDTELWFRLGLEYSIAYSTRCTGFYTQQTGGIMESGTRTFSSERGEWQFGLSIDRALDNSRYSSFHKDIRAFKRRLMVNAVKQELYHGNAIEARTIIEQCRLAKAKVPLHYCVLALLPPSLLKSLVRSVARFRNSIRSSLR